MEKQELQRKIIATVLATFVLCALLGVSIWLLLTTDVFTALIKGLMIFCCALLAIAIAGFLRNKIVEIRTLRLCVRDRVSGDDYAADDSVDTMSYGDYADDFESDSFNADFGEVAADFDDSTNDFDQTEFDNTAAFDGIGVGENEATANLMENDFFAAEEQPAYPRAPAAATATPQQQPQQPARPVARTAVPAQQVAPTQPIRQTQRFATEPLTAPQTAHVRQTAQMQPTAPTQPLAPRQAAQAQQMQQVARTQQIPAPSTPAQPAAQAAPAAPRPLSDTQLQVAAYSAQLAREQAAQRAASIARAQERARSLQTEQDTAAKQRILEMQQLQAKQSAMQQATVHQAVAQQQASYTHAPQANAYPAQNGSTPPVSPYAQAQQRYSTPSASDQAAPAPQAHDPSYAARMAQATASARAAAAVAERETQARNQSAAAAANAAAESAARATVAATRAEARLRALAGLPPLEADVPSLENAVGVSPVTANVDRMGSIGTAPFPDAVTVSPYAVVAPSAQPQPLPNYAQQAQQTPQPVSLPDGAPSNGAPSVPKQPTSWLTDSTRGKQ